LKKALEGSISPSTSDDALVAALEVLKIVDGHEIASDEVKMLNNDVDSAIKALVRDAITNYGFSPRVIYGAIFQPIETNELHERAMTNLSYKALEKLTLDFRTSRVLSTDIEHHLVSVSLIMRYDCIRDSWTMSVRSIRIAKKVVVAMKQEEDQRLWQMYNFFQRTMVASSMAGCVFEAIAHRILCKSSPLDTKPASSVGKALTMHSDGRETPTFSIAIPSSAFGTPLAPTLPLWSNGRKDTIIDLDCNLDNFQADGDKYYILKDESALEGELKHIQAGRNKTQTWGNFLLFISRR